MVLFANGVFAGALPSTGSPEMAVTWVFENVSLDPETRFLNLLAVSSDGRRLAITNPVWLEGE